MQPKVVAALALLLALPASGCLESYRDFEDFDTDSPYRNPGVFEGVYMTGGSGTLPMVSGVLRPALRPEVVILESERPAYGAAAPVLGLTGIASANGDDARVDIVMAIWRPDNYTSPTPIIVDAGPYYEVFEHCEVPGQTPCLKMVPDTIEHPGQSTPMLLQNMLPRGYTIVQLAVRGTGTAGGCMDLLGPDETADLDQALTWLGEQPWSNGNIGMMGVSYDGSTPWTAAGTGNPYLKTIVPISGLPDIYDLMLHNGSAETRAAVMHGTQVYWGYGFSDGFPQASTSVLDQFITGLPPVPAPTSGLGQANGRKEYQDRQNLLCPEAIEGQTVGQVAAAEGSRIEAATTYWAERDHRDDVLANYDGSVFLIHGLQDWNVDPHAAIPFNLALRAKGLEVKEWYGQWGHNTPDGNCVPGAPAWAVVPCRMDYGEVLARWFDKHLLGYSSIFNALPPALRHNETAQREFQLALEEELLGSSLGDLLDTGPAIQVQDDLGFWRNADSFPPADPTWMPLSLGADGVLGSSTAGEVTLKAAAAAGATGPTNIVQLVSEPFEHGLHVSGMPQLKVPFEVTGQGGFLAAWLFDMDPNGLVRSPSVIQTPIAPDSSIMTWKPAGIPVVGHAQMNLRFHAGGEDPQVLEPGRRYVAQMEFEPLEVHIPDGHRLALWLFQYPYPDHSPAATPSDVVVSFDGDARLLLPTLDIDPRTVFPVPGVAFPNETVVPQMYVHVPVLQGAEPDPGARSRPLAADGAAVRQVPVPCLPRLARCAA